MRAGYRRPPWRAGAAPRRTAAGFTLLELLASSAVFAIVMVAVYMMYESNQRIFWTGDARATAQQNARVALEDITAAIRRAGSFYCPPPPPAPWLPSSSPPACRYPPYKPPPPDPPPDSLCRETGSGEAVRIATADTLSLHGGYRDPDTDPTVGPNQDCNIYVTYSLWNAAGIRDTALQKETRYDGWGRGQLVQAPLAENVAALTFTYFDVNGMPIPLPLPAPATPTCPSGFPWARPRFNYALDDQGAVASGTTPSAVEQGSQRDIVRTIRVQITVETNIAYDTASGCYRKDVGGPTQAFTLVSEASVRGLIP